MPSLTQLTGLCLAGLPGGRAGLDWAAGAHARRQAPIFLLHRVLPDAAECYDPNLVVTVAAFESFLDWLAPRYEVVPLPRLQPRLRAGDARRPLCALTFDDGWSDTFTHAFPRLRSRALPATVFLPLEFIGGGRRFWQERLHASLRALRALPDPGPRLRAVGMEFPWCPELGGRDLDFGRLRALLLRRASPEAEAWVDCLEQAAGAAARLPGRAFLDWDEVQTMRAAGIGFGSHTLHHTCLAAAAPAAAARELAESRRRLGERLGERLDRQALAFSYPDGGAGRFSAAQLRAAGYECAVTARPGLVRADSDPWRLPRIGLSHSGLGGPAPAPRRLAAALPLRLARARLGAPPPRSAPPPRLRIGYIVDNPEAWADAPSSHRAGSELQLRRMIAALDPDYFAPELYFLRCPPGGMPTRLPLPGFAAASAGAGRLATLRGLYRLLRERRPDVVQTLFVDGMFLGVPAAWLARVPAILCARRNGGHWKRPRHRWPLALVNRLATAWQCNSSSIAASLRADEGIAPEAIEIVPNLIDLDRFAPGAGARRAARAALGLPADAFVALSVANYTPVKDLETLVRAAAIVVRSLPQARFILLGEGPERARLAALAAELGLGERVALAGATDQVAVHLAAADVGVLCSRSEGCSNAVLEYMAAGLPTVLSDIAGNRALVGAGADAEMFPVGDSTAAAAALLRLASDPARRAATGARRRQAEQYGGELAAARVQAHYLRAAARFTAR